MFSGSIVEKAILLNCHGNGFSNPWNGQYHPNFGEKQWFPILQQDIEDESREYITLKFHSSYGWLGNRIRQQHYRLLIWDQALVRNFGKQSNFGGNLHPTKIK